MLKLKSKAVREVKTAMVKEQVQEMCGLGLTREDVGVELLVVDIKIARAKNNKNFIVVAFDET